MSPEPEEASSDDAGRRSAIGVATAVRRIGEFDPTAPRRLARVAALSFAGGVMEAALAVALARVAVTVAAGDDRLSLLPGWRASVSEALALAAGALVLKLILNVVSARVSAATATHVLGTTRFALLDGFFRASLARQSGEGAGELQDLITTHVDRTTAVVVTLANLLAAALNVATLVVAALAVNPVAAGAIAATGLALSALLRPVSGIARRNAAVQAVAGRRFAGAVTETADLAAEVRTFAVADRVLERLRRLHGAQAERYERSRFLLLLAPQLYQSAALLMLIAGIALLGVRGVSSLDEVGPVVLLLLRALSYGQQGQSNYQQLNDLFPYVDELGEWRGRYAGDQAREGTRPITAEKDIEFDRVSFAYEPGSPVLEDVSFRVHAGETVGVIGPSGSGKSTLMQLLLRLRDPCSGAVRLGGVDAREFLTSDWCRKMAFVPQDARLFTGTVSENIAFFRDIDRATVERVARLTHLHDEIALLPRGYDEPLGPSGRTLSGGQQQRLCIARALANDPDVLVLDEPTSALDMRSEARIQETLAGLHGSVTLLIVAHRMTTVSACDRILVLTDGRVQGFDAHDRLLATSPFYEEVIRLSTITASAAPSRSDGP